jgi:glycosyltransferase involved in cell wall biosynthesis
LRRLRPPRTADDGRQSIVHVMGWRSQQYGSFERFLVSLSRRCEAHGAKTHLVFQSQPPSRQFVEDVHAEVHVVPQVGIRHAPTFALGLSRVLRRTGATHLHAHFGSDAYAALALARLRGVRRRFFTKHITPRGPETLESKLRHRWLAGQVETVFAVSERVSLELVSLGVPAEKIEVCYLGIDGEAYRPDPAARFAVRAELGIPDGRLVVLSTSHMRPVKGVEVLPELAAALAVQPGHAIVLAAGDGPLRPVIEARAAELSLTEENFRVLGLREDVPRLLTAADLFVLPSEVEGTPLGAMEAMAAGVPVVATAVSDLQTLIGSHARLVPPGNAPALIDACRQTLADPNVRARTEAGRRDILDRFGVEAATSMYAAHYFRDSTVLSE